MQLRSQDLTTPQAIFLVQCATVRYSVIFAIVKPVFFAHAPGQRPCSLGSVSATGQMSM
jgi:hypothetical protein